MPNFKVDAAQRRDRLRPDGGTSQVYVVWLTTDLGATGQVSVPATVWGSDDLGSFLQTEADKLDKAFHIVNGV
jgi:hypothetical protein